MKALYVLYDEECAFCRRCRDWLGAQPQLVRLQFTSFQSTRARTLFPSLGSLQPGEQLVVISDEGAVYRGPHAWIICLWALHDYREHAFCLANPLLLPFAGIACQLLSQNRGRISRWLLNDDPSESARILAVHRSQPRGRNACSGDAA